MNPTEITSLTKMSEIKRCNSCEHYAPKNEFSGKCSCKKFVLGYLHYYIDYDIDPYKAGSVDLDGVNVEDDEGWGFTVGKNFGCIHHTAFSRSVDE